MVEVSKFVNDYIKNLNMLNVDEKVAYSIIAFFLKLNLNNLILSKNNICLSENDVISLTNLLDKYYVHHIPMQYITGKVFFFNEEYIVNENVLIPRPDTEILVETAITYIDKFNLKNGIDMCTGSGCVGISIANNSNISHIDLVDVSKSALDVAKNNIILNNVQSKCDIIFSDILSHFTKNTSNFHNKYDIIVSNPPYIKSDDIDNLSEYVKKEPILALDGGKDGILLYKRILSEAKYILSSNSYCIFEIGYDQKNDLINLINSIDSYEYIDCIKDYGGNDRVVICRFHRI